MYEISNDVLVETVDGQCLLLDLKSNQYFSLNKLGLAIVESIQDGGDSESIHSRLQERFTDLSAARLRVDLDAFIKQLIDANLIREVS